MRTPLIRLVLKPLEDYDRRNHKDMKSFHVSGVPKVTRKNIKRFVLSLLVVQVVTFVLLFLAFRFPEIARALLTGVS